MTPAAPHGGRLTAVVTGASSGIGAAAAVGLARCGYDLELVGRDRDRLAAVADDARAESVEVRWHPCDFADLDQVHTLGVRLRRTCPRVDVLASNAGGMYRTRQRSAQGFERTFQVDHLAGVLLATMLRERLAGGRLVVTSSDSHADGAIDPDDLDGDRVRYSAGGRYSAAKQANLLFVREATRRWPDVLSVGFHPGEVRTEIGRGTIAAWYFRYNPLLQTAARGAQTLLWLALAPAHELTRGGYYHDSAPHPVRGRAADDSLARRLWTACEAALGDRAQVRPSERTSP